MQARGGDSPPLPPPGAQGGPPGLRLPGLPGGVRGAGGARGPCSLRLDWSPASNPSPRGGTSRKRSHPSPDKIQVMGGGRRKSFSAESTEPTGLHPASTVRCRHKAAPPPPRPPLPRSSPPHALWPARGGGWAGPGLAALGRRRRPRRGGSSPVRERGREPGSGARPPARVGAGAGAGVGGGAFLETLAKYSQRIGAFLEMRRRRQPRPVGAEPGVLQTGGRTGGGRDSPFPTPRGPEEGAWAGPPSWGRAGVLHMRSRDPSAGVQGA